MIVYPMGLPPYDPILMEFENREELEGTQAFLEIIPFDQASIWFCGKEMIKTKILSDHIGKNEKSKVIVKIQKVSHHLPDTMQVLASVLGLFFRLDSRLAKERPVEKRR